MSCNCVRDNEARVAEHIGKQLGVECKAKAGNVAITLGVKSSGERPFMPYMVRADKPGYRSQAGKAVSMFFTFCPWCGEKFDEIE